MNRELWGTVFAVCTAIVSGFAIPINKIFVVGLDPAVFTAVRALIIGIVFLVLALVQSRKGIVSFRKVRWRYLVFIGLVGGAMAFLLFFTGLKFTTGGRAAFLHKTLPIFITALAVPFLRERVSKKQFYALVMMFAGAVLIYITQIPPDVFWANPGLGDLLVLGATFFWAVENVAARRVMLKGESNFVVSFGRMFIGAIFLFIAVGMLGKADLLLSLTAQQWANLFISTAILFMYVFFWYFSIKLINVSKAGTILLLAPVISLLLGIAIFGEPAPVLQLAGSALILIGAYFVVKIRSEFATGA